MKIPIAVRLNNRLFNSLLIFSGITFMLVWLPFLRCLFDGKSYSLGQDYFGFSFRSAGIEPDYFILIPFLVFFVAFFYSFYWIKNRAVFYVLIILWWIHTFGNLLFGLIRDGDSTFHGDTLDVHISISMIVIPLSILAILLILGIILKDRKLPEVAIPWNRRNNIKILLILGPLPLQAIMYATGEAHGLTDEISVLITILQSFLIPIIFFPSKKKTE